MLNKGIGSLMDLFGTAYCYNPSSSDYEALKSDWVAIGDDIWWAVNSTQKIWDQKRSPKKEGTDDERKT